jgi:hypothetical protein
MTTAAAPSLDSIPIEMDGYFATITAPRELGPTIRSVFVDLVRSPSSVRGAEIVVTGSDDEATITLDGRQWDPGDVDVMIDRLTYVLLRASLDADAGRLHLHAGYVADTGSGVLIAGFPGSGKSTLVAKLVESGFDYLSEERVALDVEGRLSGLPKPISIVAGSFEQLSKFDPASTGEGAASARLWHVPATAIRRGSVTRQANPRVLAFVEYHERAPLEVVEVHRAEAVRLLLADSPDAQRFGPSALPVVAGLCASVRCIRIRFGNAIQAMQAIEQQLSLAPVDPASVSVMHFERSIRRSSGGELSDRAVVVSPTSGLVGVLLEDRCVVIRAIDSEVIELDQTSAMWLQLLDSSTPLSDIISEVADANEMTVSAVEAFAHPVVEQLRSAGLVQ